VSFLRASQFLWCGVLSQHFIPPQHFAVCVLFILRLRIGRFRFSSTWLCWHVKGGKEGGLWQDGRSSPLAKGNPVLGISGLDPRILAFSTPENAPTEKKKVGEKKVIKTTPKKKCEHCLLCWPAGAKKKSRG
jgi:hypothetical protein